MSIDEIPENSSNESSNRRANKGGYSPLLVGFLIVGSVIGVRACNHARRTHERERERDIRHAQMMNEFYQNLEERISKNYNSPIVPSVEESGRESQERLLKQIEEIHREAELRKYQGSSYEE